MVSNGVVLFCRLNRDANRILDAHENDEKMLVVVVVVVVVVVLME